MFFLQNNICLIKNRLYKQVIENCKLLLKKEKHTTTFFLDNVKGEYRTECVQLNL